MNRKKLILSFLAGLVGMALLINALDTKKIVNPGIVDHFSLKSPMVTQLTSKNDLFTWLDQEEKEVWSELGKTLNLTLEEFETLKKEKLADYTDSLAPMIKNYGSGEKVSQPTIDFIKGMMVEFGVNPEPVTIIAWNFGSAAAATDTLIFVNEAIFNKLSLNEKKYSIGHELIHLINKDHSTKSLIEELEPNLLKDTHDFNNAYNRLSRFQEYRADILSCFKGIEYAQGSISFFKEHIKINGNAQNPSHPLSSLRLELGLKIAGFFADSAKA